MKLLPRNRLFLTLLHLTALGLLLATAAWFATAPLTFFSNDVGLRFLQMRTLIAQGWRSFAIPYPLQAVDPAFQHVPYYYAYSLVNERLFLQISPFFPAITAWFYQLLGQPALALAPVLGSLLAAWSISRLAVLTRLPYAKGWLWLTVLATPLLFYSLQLWDHAWGTGLTTAGMAAAAAGVQAGRRPFWLLGGLLIGLGLGQRPEIYMFALAAGAGLLLATWPQWRPTAWLALGGGLGALPLWLAQWRWFGHPLGPATAPHLFGYGRPDAYPVTSYSEVTITPAIKMGRLLFELEARDAATFSAVLCFLVGFLLLFFAMRLGRYQRPFIVGGGVGLLLLAYGIWLWAGWQQPITGVISTLPVVALGLIPLPQPAQTMPESPRVYRFVAATAWGFLGGMVLIWPSFGGAQWGARYLLPVYPLLLLLAGWTAVFAARTLLPSCRSLLQRGVVLLLILSVLLQIVGVRHIYHGVAEQIPQQAQIAALPVDVIFTNHPFLPAFMSSIDTPFLYVASSEELIDLLPRSYAAGIRHIAVLPLESGQLALPAATTRLQIIQSTPVIYELKQIEE